MKVIIIEDEKLSAQHLEKLLYKVDEKIEVVTTIDTVKNSIALLKNGLQADLIFLDIHLADGLSFEIFKEIDTNIPIIFTTAYDEYALEAFKVNSIDYLLKPINNNDLERAINKFHKVKPQYSQALLNNTGNQYRAKPKNFKTRFLVKSGTSIDSILTEEVHYFTTIESISFLVLSNGKKYAIDYTLEQLEEQLDSYKFFRINRKTIINIKAIKQVSTFFNSRLAITADNLLEEARIVSRERVVDFKAWLDGK